MELWELGEVAKAAKYADRLDAKEYRPSRLQAINPRSETYVREGSAIRRIGGPVLGGLVGGAAGQIPGTLMKNPAVASVGGMIGGSLGATAGYHRNIKSKDTVSFERGTGKRAKSKFQVPSVGVFNRY